MKRSDAQLPRLVVVAALGAALAACAVNDRVAGPRCDGAGRGPDGNADANGDGMCDCLRIGVLGYPGTGGGIDQIRAWMRGRAVATEILPSQVLTPEVLQRLDVVIVQDVRDGVAGGTVGREGIGLGIGRSFSAAEVQALAAWVDAGGGLMTLTGYATTGDEVANVNRLLAPYGLSYGTQRILAGADPTAISSWAAAHPIALGVARVLVNGGFPVAGGTLVASSATPVPYDVGRAATSGRGHVFAWGDDWISYDAQWVDTTCQVKRLWQNAFAWLTVAGYCQLQLD